MSKQENGLAGCGFVIIIIAVISLFIFSASQESKTYNKLTGKNTTTWDAMWVELRVEDGVKD
jgi:hypothetical protein